MKAVKQISIKKEKYNICDTELRKALGGSAQEIKLSELSEDFDINNYTKSGIYHIKGKRINTNTDNMPNNVNTTIDAILQVLKNDEDICVTQILSISNSNSIEGNGIYTRTGCKEINKNSFSWNQWAKLQTNIELGYINNYSILDTCINNGIYSGHTDYMSFIMFVINYEHEKCISQFMYSINVGESNDAKVNFKYRKCDTTTNKWSDWEKSLSNKINYSDIKNSDKGDGEFAEAIINTDGLSLTIGSILNFNNKTPFKSINIKPGDVNYNTNMISFNRGDNSISLGLNTNPNQIIINGNNDINVKIGNDVDINSEVKIGTSVDIDSNVFLHKGVKIGTNADINSNVFLQEGVNIGSKVNIDENISINYDLNNLTGNSIAINGTKTIENENNELEDININFKIGNDVNIKSDIYLYEGIRMGTDVNIGREVEMGEGVYIGQNVYIGNNLKISTELDSNKKLTLKFVYTTPDKETKIAYLPFE